MLGAIIGDIVGSAYEFNPTNSYDFEMFKDGSQFTDDTICTIAIADALLKGRDYGESHRCWMGYIQAWEDQFKKNIDKAEERKKQEKEAEEERKKAAVVKTSIK